jgi:hypothetical protein
MRWTPPSFGRSRCRSCSRIGIYCCAASTEGVGDLWQVKQRVLAAKADGDPFLRLLPLWHCAQPPLTWGTSIPIGPFETCSNGTGWQSRQDNAAAFTVFFRESTARCRIWENATGSIRFKVMMISAVGIGSSENPKPMPQPVKN